MAWFDKKDEKDKHLVDEQVRLIYQEYETLKRRVPNGKDFEDEFHLRYKKIVRDGSDLKLFLDGELIHAQKLNAKYVSKQEEAKNEVARRKESKDKLDAEIGKLAANFMHYPKSLHVDAMEFTELAHLYGALNLFESTHWTSMASKLRKDFAMTGNSPLTFLEHELMEITSPQPAHPPKALSSFLNSYKNEREDVEHQALEAMKIGSFFFNDVKSLMDSVRFPPSEKEYEFVAKVISDFRLNNIKRRTTP
jgi:hypothetical protein